jgi:hypothetical protein
MVEDLRDVWASDSVDAHMRLPSGAFVTSTSNVSVAWYNGGEETVVFTGAVTLLVDLDGGGTPA